MILEEIRLTDFRCFHGKTSIRFSTDPEKNVTLIYAETGFGKTTLLNALLWCFYGETTARFEKRDDILNYDAKADGRAFATVEVLFEHNGNDYIAKRFSNAGSSGSSDHQFRAARINQGHQEYISPAETFINTVIPKEMASHFLFDGEYAEIFLGEKNKSATRSAVRDILGCSLIETAIEDLKAISNYFRKQIPLTSASSRIDDINNAIDLTITQIEGAEASIKELERGSEVTDQQIADIENKLGNTAAAKELQTQRETLEQHQRGAEKRKKSYEDEVFKWIGEDGRFIVSKKLTEEAFDFLDKKENRGRIPSPYNEEFVKDILASEMCICGAELKPGSEAAHRVARLFEKAANQTMRDRIAKVRARLSTLRTERGKAPHRLVRAKVRLAEANQELSSLEAQLGEIHSKLKGISFGDIAERESKREELKDNLKVIERQIGSLRANVVTAEQEKGRLEGEITQLAGQDKKTAIFAKRRNLCESIRSSLEVQLSAEEKQAKSVLRASIQKILEATTRKNLALKMSDDYLISLVNTEGVTLPKSSGENQLLGLAFTAALVEFAKVREKAQDYRLLPGTIAPLVLDSPFGQLDRVYRIATAEFIPRMASQVVLMLTESQGSDEVIDVLRPYIGSEYVLIRHNRGPIGDRKVESRYFKGKEIQITVFDSKYDGTAVVEVV